MICEVPQTLKYRYQNQTEFSDKLGFLKFYVIRYVSAIYFFFGGGVQKYFTLMKVIKCGTFLRYL